MKSLSATGMTPLWMSILSNRLVRRAGRHLLLIPLLLCICSLLCALPSAWAATPPQAGLLQYQSGGQLLGFSPQKMYAVSSGGATLTEEFVGASGALPFASSGGKETAASGDLKQVGKAEPFTGVTYKGLWNGINLSYRPTSSGFAESVYDISVDADISSIKLRYNVPVEIRKDGQLKFTPQAKNGYFLQSPPVAWQMIHGAHKPVTVAFKQYDDGTIGFSAGAYNRNYPLTIDPSYSWHTFYGGSDNDHAQSIAIDAGGNAYITGTSKAAWNGPAGQAPLHAFAGGLNDLFVLKLDSSGAYQWHSFYGGADADEGFGVAVDAGGNAYITGYSTAAWNGPAGQSPLQAYGSVLVRFFVLKLSSAGAYQWHTFYGDGGDCEARGVALDSSGNVYITGYSTATWTGSAGQAPKNAFSGLNINNIFVLKLSSAGAYQWHTFYSSGSSSSMGNGVAVDSGGNAFVTGTSASSWGSPLHAHSGGSDIFVLKLNSAGTYQWHTFYGSSGNDYGNGVAVDSSGNAYITGYSTAAWGSPIKGHNGGDDIFVLKLNSAGAYQWLTFYGSSAGDYGRGIAVDASSNVYVTGHSIASASWPFTGRAPLNSKSGSSPTDSNIFVLKLDSAGAYQWHTFYGYASYNYGESIAVDSAGHLVYVTGTSTYSWSDDNNHQALHPYSRDNDIFVFKLADRQTLTVARAGAGSGTVTSSPAGINCGTTCSSLFDYNTAITLTPTPAAGSIFGGWSGDADCADGIVALNADKSCTATFRPPTVMTQPGNSLAFNGTNQYVDLGAGASLNLTGALTIEGWVKPTSTSNMQTIFGHKNGGAANPGYALFINTWNTSDARLIFETQNSSFTTSAAAITWGVWQHVAVSWDGTNAHIYVNGIEQAAAGSVNLVSSTVNAHIGNTSSNGGHFNGIMDELRVWNVARTQAEIQDTMHHVLTGGESGLKAYYQFDESSGTLLPDLTANSTIGTLVNAPVWTTATTPLANTIASKTDIRGAWIANTNTFASGRMSIVNAVVTGTNVSLFGHDNTTDAWQTTDVPAGQNSRLTRVWRAETRGSATGTIKIDTTGLSDFGDGSTLRLLVDSDGTFASGATALTGSYSAPYFTVTGQSIVNGSYYTLGSSRPTYSVIYNGNGNSGGTAPADGSSPYYGNSTVTVLGAGSLTKTGFNFTGWNSAANGSGTAYAAGTTFSIASATTLYAQWTHAVTASAGANGTLDAGTPSPKNVFDNETASFKFTANSGYHITGVSGCGVNYSNSADTVTTYTATTGAITADCTVSATFAQNYFSVTASGLPNLTSMSAAIGDYNKDGKPDVLITGSLSGTALTRLYRNNGDGTYTDSGISLPGVFNGAAAWGDYDNDGNLDFILTGTLADNTSISRIYHNNGDGTFDNRGNTVWNSAADGSGTDYSAGSPYSADADITLYAKWTSRPAYTITYDGNGNTGGTAPESQTKTQGTTLTLALNSGHLTKTGYTLVGWDTYPDGTSGTRYAEGATYTNEASVTLYARWTNAATYVISYNGNSNTSGLPPGAQTEINGYDLTLSANSRNLAKPGCIFAGWNSAPDGSGTDYAVNRTYFFSANTTLHAKWTAVSTYSVTYNGNGSNTGTAPVTQTKTQGIDLALAANSGGLTKTGYFFAGWNSAPDGSGTRYAEGAMYSTDTPITLYAMWTNLPTYTVTYNGNGSTSGSVPVAQTKTQGIDLPLAFNSGNLAKTGYAMAGLPGVYSGSVAWGDYDNDGRQDLILSGNTGEGAITRIYHNDGNGVFSDIGVNLPGTSSSSVAWGDYDNDGRLDFVLTGNSEFGRTTRIYHNNGDGTFSDINAGLPGVSGGSAVWGDYDNDGYLDLALNGSTDGNASGAITRIYHNNGAGAFTDINAGLSGNYHGIAAWGDYDNDGRLDLVLSGYNSTAGAGNKFLLYKNNIGNTFSFIDTGLSGQFSSSSQPNFIGWGDVDGDGRLDIVEVGRWSSALSRVIHNNGATTINTPPTAPGSLTAVMSNGAAVFSWGAATDSQTPADGLSYNLRVGSAPGRDDIFSGMAKADGTRLAPALGNMGKNRSWTGALAQGQTYYWSVQAIDTAYSGGPWATEASFTVPVLPSVTTSGITGITATGAQGGGSITQGAGSETTTARGVVWNSTGSPTLASHDGITTNGSGAGSFSSSITGLTSGQTYYVRAYATTASDTIYGSQRSFVAQNPPAAMTAPGNALVFNGSGQYVEIPATTDLDLIDNQTIELWFKPATVSGVQGLLSKKSSAAAKGWCLRLNGTEIEFNGQTTSGLGLTAGYWYHLAAVKSGATQRLYIYGTSMPLSGTRQELYDNSGPLRIGSDLGGSYFNGRIDEVRIWNMARSQQQIRENLHLVQSGAESGLIAYYTFDETSGATLYDRAQSTRLHNGALTGMTGSERVPSTIPAGSGSANSQAETLGTVTFSGANLIANFSEIGTANYTTTRIDAGPPNVAPAGNKEQLFPWWSVDRLDNSGSFNASLTFTVSQGLTAADEATPANVSLYHRGSVSDTAWSFVGNASSVNAASQTATFDNISNFGQFTVVRSAALMTRVDTAITKLPGGNVGSGQVNRPLAWGDYNNDGRQDIAMIIDVNTTKIFRNNPDGSFSDIGVTLRGSNNGNIAWGDYDNDGWLDLAIIGNASYKTYIYRNMRDGTFTPAATLDIGCDTGTYHTCTVVWGDYNNDGRPDLLISTDDTNMYPGGVKNAIYRNDGGGIFTDINAGLPVVYRSHALWGDFDNDGLLDIIVVASYGGAKIYHNNGPDSGGVYSFTASATVTEESISFNNVAVGDYDNDGYLDIAIVGNNSAFGGRIYHNNGDGSFTDINVRLPRYYEGINIEWGDYDNDGRLDLLYSTAFMVDSGGNKVIVYRNNGNNSFTDVTGSLATNSATDTPPFTGYAAWGDYDGDGKLDIAMLQSDTTYIYRNSTSSAANSAPTAPGGLSASVAGGVATLSWNAAGDSETPARGLTYNLRVGTTTGAADVLSGMANVANGLRRIPALGNAGMNRSWKLGGLTPGQTYYWNVQAVDTAFAGGAWGTEGSFLVPGTTEYTVAYDGNGATSGSVPVDSSAYLPAATVTVKANSGTLARINYTFNGWNTAANGSGTVYAASGSATFAMGTANVTLYAQWTALPTYSVTYDGNGSTTGTAPTDSTSYLNGATVTVKANSGSLARANYTFSGWNTAANGSGTSYAASGSASFTMGAANVTLYAQWTALPTYSVTYNGNSPTSGTAPVDGSSPYLSDSTVIVLGNSGGLVKTGFRFNGWNTLADGSGTGYAAAATFTIADNTTLYAQWAAVPPATAGNGVTIITHGWNPDATAPTWLASMRDDIAAGYLGNEQNYATITVTKPAGSLVVTTSPWNFDLSAGVTGQLLVILDWTAVANHITSGVTAQAVAAAVVDKITTSQNGKQPLAELPIHLIGHSRGGGLVLELARLLGEQGVVVDQVTPLDPHPLTMADAQPFTPVIDTPAAIYQNVIFSDVYYQDNETPAGQYINGAYNRPWGYMAGGYHDASQTFANHRNIYLMYQGSINPANPVNNGEAAMDASERADWFNSYENSGANSGFYYSHLKGTGNRAGSAQPVTSLDAVKAGLNSDALFGGTGSRQALTWASATWPNIAALDILSGGTALGQGDRNVTIGTPLDLRYVYLDYASGSTVTLHADVDHNPYNNNDIAVLNTQAHSATGATYTGNTYSWDTSGLSAGDAMYIYAKITDGTKTRYFYAPSRLVFTAGSTYTVTYDANTATSGTVPADSNNYLTGASVTVLANSGSLAKTGYSFNGWNTLANGTGTSRAAAATFTMGSANVTLYAQWTALPVYTTYTVTYNGNSSDGGTTPVDGNSPYLTGDTVTVLANSFTKTGYSFAGWNTAANGTGTSYNAGATFSIAGNTTLYAQWTALPNHTVSFNSNGGTGSMSAQTTNVTTNLTANSFTRSGYSFAGWNTAANSSGTAYADQASYSFTADVTLYAQWTALTTYAVTYNTNGATSGTAPTAQIKTQGIDLALATNSGNLAKTGYSFAGWNTATDGTGTSYAVGATYSPDEAITLYAKWITTDTTGPNLTVSTLANGAKTKDATLNVAGTVSDSGSGVKSVTVNGTAATNITNGSFSVAITLVDGANSITTIATDNVGNTTTDTRSITLDQTAPGLTITLPADNSITNKTFVEITGTVDDSTATITANGSTTGVNMNGNNFSVMLDLTSGLNTIDITATDPVGNSSSVKRTITSDTTMPTLAVTVPAQDITTTQGSITLRGTVTDIVTSVNVSITVDDQTFTPTVTDGSFSQEITLATEKTYNVIVIATDQAGNQATTVQRNIIKGSTIASGDINGDGIVDIADALKALRIAVGLETATESDYANGDVAPLVNGKPAPDGIIDIADATVILMKTVGLRNW